MHLVILLYALFASLFVLLKDTLSYGDPFFIVGSRMAFAGFFMLVYQAIRNPQSLKLSRQGILLIILLSILHIYLTNIAEIWAINNMISAKACLLYSLSPFVSALVCYGALKETLSAKKWLGLTIGFFGVLPCLSDCFSWSLFSTLTASGELAMLVAVICSVCGWIILKQLVGKEKCSPMVANGYSMFFGGIFALLHSYLSGESWNPLPIHNQVLFLKNTLLLCLISNVICYNLYGHLLKKYSATFMAFAGLVTPLFASLFGWLYLGETVSPTFFLSLVLFATGLYFYHQEEIAITGFNIKTEPVLTTTKQQQTN